MFSKEMKGKFLLDTDAFISYISGDELVEQAEKIVELITDGAVEAFVSSMLYDDVISALRSKGMEIDDVIQVLVAIASIPHVSLPITTQIAISALTLYMRHGGPRKLHYFDAFHVATARYHELPMITSDNYINEHQKSLGITAYNLRKI
ncbi:PIN domain-containing protein [Candidatus Bathyarchaeota archaeon]|nr:PIN domain-containing protein [Candidatus Bathyarchaeota archaeon]